MTVRRLYARKHTHHASAVLSSSAFLLSTLSEPTRWLPWSGWMMAEARTWAAVGKKEAKAVDLNSASVTAALTLHPVCAAAAAAAAATPTPTPTPTPTLRILTLRAAAVGSNSSCSSLTSLFCAHCRELSTAIFYRRWCGSVGSVSRLTRAVPSISSSKRSSLPISPALLSAWHGRNLTTTMTMKTGSVSSRSSAGPAVGLSVHTNYRLATVAG